ncbi:unnamed protein product [Polarella glacialis]|uniref:Transporter n=1 Tax=Polarella glacialis TaxID=89957 RepID=A0A813GGA0_POLGL|nr:unnamed protein product [Polarella glacialis]
MTEGVETSGVVLSISQAAPPQDADVGGQEYDNKAQYILSLVGYAVGLGNLWRFPYLAYTYGGGAFLIPYFFALFFLGLPLFILELGLGQMTRRGTLGMWLKLGLPRMQGVGVAATCCTFMVGLYYNVILGWTIYYFGRTLGALPSGVLPWSDQAEGFVCPETVLYPKSAVANDPYLINPATGLFNASFVSDFWCPEVAGSQAPAGFQAVRVRPLSCPARSAAVFWEEQALQQSSGLDDPAGLNPGMVFAFTIAWLLVYLCVFQGVKSSGKVVYVTATLPYFCLLAFLIRAALLPNAHTGLKFFLIPDWSILGRGQVWLAAAVQIFYSLGVGFGSLITFASCSSKHNDFVRDAMTIAFINCSTSVLSGCVVFPILGFLVSELQGTSPCISGDSLDGLKSIGLSGTGLAFIAFPIAIARMPGSFFFAILFFVMLLCLGIDSQFAMLESVVSVLSEAGVGRKFSRPVLSGMVCLVSYLIGLIFVCRGGLYWFNLLDTYTSVLALFVVTCLECVGLTWASEGKVWLEFKQQTQEWTGRELGPVFHWFWKWVCPGLTLALLLANFIPPTGKVDLMGAGESLPYPEGQGYLPTWSISFGWFLAVVPLLALLLVAAFPQLVYDAGEEDHSRNLSGNAENPAGSFMADRPPSVPQEDETVTAKTILKNNKNNKQPDRRRQTDEEEEEEDA